jgi:hypothetical protein
MIEHFADRYPEVVILSVGLASLLVVVAVACVLDVFLGGAESEPPSRKPVPSPAPRATQADQAALAEAHHEVVRRHAVLQAHGSDRVFLVFAAEDAPGLIGRCRSLVATARGWREAVEHAQIAAMQRGWPMPAFDSDWTPSGRDPEEWSCGRVLIQRAAVRPARPVAQEIDRFHRSARRLERLSVRGGRS